MSTRGIDAIDTFFVPAGTSNGAPAATRLTFTAALCLIGARLLALLVARLTLATLPPALLTTLALLLVLLRTLARLLRLLALLPSALLAAWLALLAPLAALAVALVGRLLWRLIAGRLAFVLSSAAAALHDLLLAQLVYRPLRPLLAASLALAMRVMWWAPALVGWLSALCPLTTGLLPTPLALPTLLTGLLATLALLVALAAGSRTTLLLTALGHCVLSRSFLSRTKRLLVLRVSPRGPAATPAAVCPFLGRAVVLTLLVWSALRRVVAIIVVVQERILLKTRTQGTDSRPGCRTRVAG